MNVRPPVSHSTALPVHRAAIRGGTTFGSTLRAVLSAGSRPPCIPSGLPAHARSPVKHTRPRSRVAVPSSRLRSLPALPPDRASLSGLVQHRGPTCVFPPRKAAPLRHSRSVAWYGVPNGTPGRGTPGFTTVTDCIRSHRVPSPSATLPPFRKDNKLKNRNFAE